MSEETTPIINVTGTTKPVKSWTVPVSNEALAEVLRSVARDSKGTMKLTARQRRALTKPTKVSNKAD